MRSTAITTASEERVDESRVSRTEEDAPEMPQPRSTLASEDGQSSVRNECPDCGGCRRKSEIERQRPAEDGLIHSDSERG